MHATCLHNISYIHMTYIEPELTYRRISPKPLSTDILAFSLIQPTVNNYVTFDQYNRFGTLVLPICHTSANTDMITLQCIYCHQMLNKNNLWYINLLSYTGISVKHISPLNYTLKINCTWRVFKFGRFGKSNKVTNLMCGKLHFVTSRGYSQLSGSFFLILKIRPLLTES